MTSKMIILTIFPFLVATAFGAVNSPPGPKSGVPKEEMFPWGADAGDITVFNQIPQYRPTTEQRNMRVYLDTRDIMGEEFRGFPYLGKRCNELLLSKHGSIDCTDDIPGMGETDSMEFAVFSLSGSANATDEPAYVGIRGTNNKAELGKASAEVRRYYPDHRDFVGTYMVVATWVNVTCNGYYCDHPTYSDRFTNGDKNGTNTYQTAIVTDGKYTFWIIYMVDIQFDYAGDYWVGVYDGNSDIDYVLWYKFSNSYYLNKLIGFTSGDMMAESNTGYPGKWMLRVDSTLPSHPVPLLYEGEQFCNDHGAEVCTCARGFEGGNCQDPIDWCKKPLFPNKPYNKDTNPLFEDMCQPHGNCTADPILGANCTCRPESGYHGMFCKTAKRVLNACLRFEPAHGTVAGAQALATYPVGCDFMDTEEEEWACLPNSLSCLKSELSPHCEIPLGWCLPKNEVENIESATTAAPGATHAVLSIQTINTASPDPCASGPCQNDGTCGIAVNGQFECRCSAGFGGVFCETSVTTPKTTTTMGYQILTVP